VKARARPEHRPGPERLVRLQDPENLWKGLKARPTPENRSCGLLDPFPGKKVALESFQAIPF